MNIQKNNSKHRLFIRLIVLVFAFVMFIPQMTVKAAGTITDQNNNSYSSFADAIAATNEGDNLELTISGSFTENIDISKNINVTITSEADTSISGVIILNNGSLTIQGTSANKLAVNGTMDINNGTFEADYLNVTGTITIGHPSAAKTLATIKNTDINSSSEGIFLHDKNTKLELLDNCTINAVSGIVVNSGADIGTISNSNIQGSFYGVRVQAGHGTETYRDYQIEVDKIVNCNITMLKDESINDVEDTHYTALSFASWGFGDTDITVGSIEECTITTNAKNTWKGAIGAYSYSKFANQEPWGKVRIGSINDCVLTATSGACGLFNQCSDIGEMKNNTITAHNMGAGIAVTVCAYLNGSDPRVETPAAGHIGLIDNNTIKALGPNYGTGIYLSTMFDDVDTIGAIKNTSIEAQRIGIHVHGNSGNIGSIEDTTITQTGANTTAAPNSYGGIILANSDTNDAEHININLIRNLTINSDTYGINVFGGNKISLIDDCEINTVKDAIYNILSEITTIQNTKVVCSENGGYAVYNAGDIDTIKDSDLTTKNSIGIYQTMSTSGNYTKGNIKLIDNVKITNSDPTSRTVSQGIYFAEHHNDDAVVQNCTITGYRRGIENHSKIDKIINNTINCNYNGIYNEAEEYGSPLESTINLIDNNNITLSRSTGGSGILNFKGGIIDKISNNSITGQEAGIACERNNSLIRVLENNTVKSYNYGIRVLETGKIGEIKSGWYEDVTATGQGLWIASDGSKVETISGGTIIGKQNGVLISNNGALGTITGDPVFYGKAKYAIDNTDQKSPINIEPTLQQDLPPIGYARYYGPTGFIVNEPEKDIYPNYTPGGYDYFMSVIGTDENVDELEGIPFHYLTINVALSYDKNAEKATGDMSNKSKLVEAGTVLTIEDNLFEYKDHEFIIWNTKSNNSGTPYQPQDSITLLEDTILYAQWRSPAPKTGDNSSYGLWLSILIVSMFVIIMDIRYILKSKKA